MQEQQNNMLLAAYRNQLLAAAATTTTAAAATTTTAAGAGTLSSKDSANLDAVDQEVIMNEFFFPNQWNYFIISELRFFANFYGMINN